MSLCVRVNTTVSLAGFKQFKKRNQEARLGLDIPRSDHTPWTRDKQKQTTIDTCR